MTKPSAASNGSKASEPDKPKHGLPVLREKEAQGLISLVTDAMSQTSHVIYDLHSIIYGHGNAVEGESRDRGQMLDEALKCLGTTEHYLLMLGSVCEEEAHSGPGPLSVEPAF